MKKKPGGYPGHTLSGGKHDVHGSRLVFGNTEASGGVKYNGLSILAEGNAVL